MGLLSKITGQYIGIILCVIAIIVILAIVFLRSNSSNKEGFFSYPVNAQRIQYEETSKRRYNAFADLSNPTREDVIPSGTAGDTVVNSLLSTPSYEDDSSGPGLARSTPRSSSKSRHPGWLSGTSHQPVRLDRNSQRDRLQSEPCPHQPRRRVLTTSADVGGSFTCH